MPQFAPKDTAAGLDKGLSSDATDTSGVSGFPGSGGGESGAFAQGLSPWSNLFATTSDPPPGSPATPPDEGFDPNPSGDTEDGPGTIVAVTSGGVTFNLTFDAAAPSSFRSGILQAASILTAAISDQITVNLTIHYTGTGGGAFAGPSSGLFESYSSTTAALTGHASLGDTIFNALPGGSSIQGQSSVAVWNAQLKALGYMSATNAASDGTATFARDINSNLLVGVALHELTHAMGRVPYGPQPDIFDLFRFTSAGSRLFNASTNSAPPAYFSVDGGFSRLADYGQTSDTSDFLNTGTQGSNDPFNEFYTSGTSQQLTLADLFQLDALGFHLTALAPTAIELSGSTNIYRSFTTSTISFRPGPRREASHSFAPLARRSRAASSARGLRSARSATAAAATRSSGRCRVPTSTLCGRPTAAATTPRRRRS